MAGLKNQSLLSGNDADKERLWDDNKGKYEYNISNGERVPFKNNQHSSKDSNKDEQQSSPPPEKVQMVGMFELFRFADGVDKVLMFFGLLTSMTNGSIMPLLIVVFGKTMDFVTEVGRLKNYVKTIPEYLTLHGYDVADFMANTKLLDDTMCDDIADFYQGTMNCTIVLDDRIMDKMRSYCLLFGILGVAGTLLGYCQLAAWLITAERQTHRIRQFCLQNILRQDIGWFDTYQVAEITTRLSDDISKIHDGIGQKTSALFRSATAIILSAVIGFVYGWQLTLVMLCCSPIIGLIWTWMGKLAAGMTNREANAYGKAGAIAEEVFGAIRTVVAFGGQEKEAMRYCEHLDEARRHGVRKGFTNGSLIGANWMIMFCCYGLGFWYGGKLHRDDPDDFDIGDLFIVFYIIMYLAYELGNLAPGVQSQAIARGAASSIFKLIDMESKIDSSSEEGYKPTTVKGLIQFKNVHFHYPARPDVKVLNNLTIEARPGQTVALVGSSGCGKSTVVQLLLRFYNPDQGQTLLDGRDIKDINIKWLRRSIGLVSQEPVLFADTIEQNIRYGQEDVTFDQIVTATKNANAFDFISELPDKFNTLVGERGAQLSGGQKQRIAIARALVRDPKILLLDEATSALDTESEAIVQDALDKARQGRTTVVIAHRLSTIKTADVIIGMKQGEVKESGTHAELMALGGIYHQLVTSQKTDVKDEGDSMTHTIKQEKQHSTGPVSKHAEQKKDLAETEESLPDAPFARMLIMNAPEWYYILMGCFGSIASGTTYPLLVLIITKFMEVFEGDEEDKKDDIIKYSLVFVAIGVASLLVYFLQSFMFSCAGEALTLRIRSLTFRAMLRKDIAWFDDPKNGVGALTTRLSTDAAQVQGVTVYKVGGLIVSLSSLATGLSCGFYYGWQMTFVMLAILPIMSAAGVCQMHIQAKQALKNKPAIEEAGKIITESVENIRTVAALSREQTFFERYIACMSVPYRANLKNAHIIGLLTGFAESVLFFAFAGAMAFGGYMVEEGEMSFNDVFRVYGCVLFGALSIANASALFPDMGRAQTSARRILQIIDSKPAIDYTLTDGEKLQSGYHPEVTFKEVTFNYPNRPSVPVLQGLNVSVAPGQTLALVGSSGCGKSTTIQLIERFYDSITGSVCLNNSNIKSLNVQWYRSQFGLVSQEPILFNCSIRDNIAYGDNTREVSMSDIIEAAKKANVHQFISALPGGYETNVGAKGTQLSGGQKQRIAIARALVRNPKVLLLDEATSALDTESEKVVQEALDKARKGRTCIVIAHRLSTIRSADRICVIDHGRVVEGGTHEELLDKDGFYFKLVRSSQR